MRFTTCLLMKHVDLSPSRKLTGRERNVLKKSAKISSSSRIMRFVEQIISRWGEKTNTLTNQNCTQDEKTKQLDGSFLIAKSQLTVASGVI